MHPSHLRNLGVWMGVLAVLLVAAVASHGTARAQESPPYSGDVPTEGAVLLVTSQEVLTDDLVSSLETDGCFPRVVAITEMGQWLVFVPGAPDVVNETFPESLSANTPLAVICQSEPTAEDAVAVIQRYYDNIAAENYEAAYAAWRPGTHPQTFEEFVAGFADTASVSVDVGQPGPIDPGAGQRYIEIPVVVHATLDDGTEQRFEGTFTLHRTAPVPGSTPEDRQWHIVDASLTQTA